MAIRILNVTKLFYLRADEVNRSMRYYVRDWLKENVGPSTHYADRKGDGWELMLESVDGIPNWFLRLEDDTMAVMFKLRFSC